ncbi:hypothetical protein CPC16_012093 [Podila verticillata]|nr:hypothetical protein BGZ52_006907 [Haplosporangium bisporale]KAF9207282.1 hypothetical protein BGZ59_011262 [Podila verticillata]KAF9376881.1 hypothetical protein CPC16_012093 [Podila verticillata]KFH73357.1 hypothetical protein MVEG_00573 [Podila verticillata NRRL 6337]
MTLVKSFVTTVGVALVGTLMLGSTVSAQDSCPDCSNADTVLKSCNTALLMNTWPGTMVFQPNEAQAPCACNQNFYGLIGSCLTCQSSTTAKYSVKPLDQYQQVCLSFHQQWQQIYIPNKPSTSSTAEPTATPEPSNDGPGGVSHVGLSSGAIAGIVVSAIALIVALSVAVYVYQRRKRDLRKQQEEDELYKYNSQARNSYMEVPLPQYTGMIQPSLPSLPQLTNLRVMNPDADDDDVPTKERYDKSFEVQRNSSPGWRRGSFDDD